jgi:hypothetical protein
MQQEAMKDLLMIDAFWQLGHDLASRMYFPIHVPELGMRFGNENQAWNFWSNYGGN